MSSRTCLLVLGMHRGGTSALAGTLQALGVDFGDDLLPGQADNPRGFFEDRNVVRANDEILHAAGSSWCSPLPRLNARAWTRLTRQPLVRVTGELAARFDAAPLWGSKDPRLCRLLPHWQPVFAQLGCAPRHVLVVRHPAEVIASLAARDRLESRNVQLLWLDHLLTAEADTRGQPRVFVTYDDLLTDWRAVAARIAGSLDLAWPHPPSDPAVASALDAFLSPALRHHRKRGAAGLTRAVAKVYALFRQLAALPAGNAAAEAPILAALDDHRRTASEWTWQQGAETLHLRREHHEAHRIVADQDTRLASLSADLKAVLEDRAKAQTIIETQQTEIERLRGDRQAVLADRRKAQKILEAHEASITGLHAELEGMLVDRRKAQEIIDAQAAEVTHGREGLTALREDRARAQEIIEEQQENVARLRADLESLREDRRKAQAIIEAQAAEIADVRAGLEALREDRAKAQEIMESLAAETRGARADFAILLADRREAQNVIEHLAAELKRLAAPDDSPVT